MDKDDMADEIQDSVAAFAAEYPKSALSLLTGIFVGLLEYSIEASGGDPDNEIRIDSGGNRDIIISAVTAPQTLED